MSCHLQRYDGIGMRRAEIFWSGIGDRVMPLMDDGRVFVVVAAECQRKHPVGRRIRIQDGLIVPHDQADQDGQGKNGPEKRMKKALNKRGQWPPRGGRGGWGRSLPRGGVHMASFRNIGFRARFRNRIYT